MSLCKDTTQRKVGCKKENLLVDPPVLRTNSVPDENGVTDHNPLFCKDTENTDEPEQKTSETKVDYKNKQIVLGEIHSEGVVDGFRQLGAYVWATRAATNGNELYYVWSKGTVKDPNLQERFKYRILFENDEKDVQNSVFESRKVNIKVIGNFLSGKKKFGNGDETTLKAVLDTPTNKNGYETFDSFSRNIQNKIKTNKTYKDISFTLFTPFNKKDIQDFDIANNNKYKANWDFRYNFFVEEYEKNTKSTLIPVALLPNFYVWFSEIENSKNETFPNENSVKRFVDLINLGGNLYGSENRVVSLIPTINNRKEFNVRETFEFEYFDKWSKIVQNLPSSTITNISRPFTNTFLTTKDFAFSQKIKNNNSLFPMAVEFEFPNQNIIYTGDIIHNQSFLKALEISDLLAPLMLFSDTTTALENEPEDTAFTNLFESNIQATTSDSNNKVPGGVGTNISKSFTSTSNFAYKKDFYEQSSLYNNSKKTKKTTERKKYKIWDVSKWIGLFNEFEGGSEKLEKTNSLQIFDAQELNFGTFLGSHPLVIKKQDKKTYKFFKTLMFLAFSGKVKKLIKDKNRKLPEAFAFGRECHVEQVFFRIRKIDSNTNSELQNFYIANNSEADVIRWIDSQVKYGEKYRYEVYSYNIVLGTEYHYEDLEIFANTERFRREEKYKKALKDFELGTPVAEFVAKYIPKLYLVETLYYSFDGKVLDSPPVPPEVEFHNYIGVNNKILINVRANSGEQFEKPVLVEESEEDYYKELPDNLRNGEKVKFRNDDLIEEFQIYRATIKPKKITDFANVGQRFTSKKRNPAFSMIDNVEPNKKYYYMFRSVDVHGHMSNPSSIYEVEIIDDGGFSYLEIGIVDFLKDFNRKTSKDVKKYVQIEPNFFQTEIDFSNNTPTQKITDVRPKVGTQTESIFDKNYKLRITSKKTGKKLDINFKYVHKHENKL